MRPYLRVDMTAKLTRKDWLWVEERAAALGIDAPRGLEDPRFSREERLGWFIHYWNELGGSRHQLRTPTTKGEWAGWLARVVYLASWT